MTGDSVVTFVPGLLEFIVCINLYVALREKELWTLAKLVLLDSLTNKFILN